jgi:hypothetical protein
MLAGRSLRFSIVVLIAAAAGCHRGDKPPPPAATAAAASAKPEATAASSAAPATSAAPAASGSAAPAGFPGQIRMGSAQVVGKLRTDLVNRVVRKEFGRFKACYQAALARNPATSGRVVVKFSIDKLGMVTKSAPGQTDVSDPELVDCAAKAFLGMSFPQPDDGNVQVAFPIIFTPAQ